ncbi:MAG: ADP-ribosylglycohydrolase family protein [Chloroflexota bacterium]|jgi:ADP-ribosylglycohydrolase|nr:ADP-ribosylglycohydrolase family protein [Chloroflexota bacterium]
MLGAMIGDIVGSVYEWHNIKTTDFVLFKSDSTFTDDTVLTAATTHALMTDGDYTAAYQDFARRYPGRGYGGNFSRWIWAEDPQPYNSWGNGSAMRVSPVGFAFDTAEKVLAEAERSAAVTHNHPEGIKGAQATALAILLARQGTSQSDIRREIAVRFDYDLDRKLDDIRPGYALDVSCQGSVPESIIAFLESESYEDAIRKAISLGGDSDTIACITGGIAEAYYGGVPKEIAAEGRARLSGELVQIIEDFWEFIK